MGSKKERNFWKERQVTERGRKIFARHVQGRRRVKPSVNQHYGICMLFTREPPSTFVWIIPEINQCPFPLSLPSRCSGIVESAASQDSRQMTLVCPLYARLHHSGNVTIASSQRESVRFIRNHLHFYSKSKKFSLECLKIAISWFRKIWNSWSRWECFNTIPMILKNGRGFFENLLLFHDIS